MGLSGKYVQMLSGNIPILRGISTLYGLKQIPGPFINQISISKGAGSVLNGYESMIGQINLNLKQPENAEKFSLNFYLNQAGRMEYNASSSFKVGEKWATTFLAHFEDQSRVNDRNEDMFLDNPLHTDYIFYNQWNYRSHLVHMEIGVNGVLASMRSGKKADWITSSNSSNLDYAVDMENTQLSGFFKIGYLFPDDDFKSLAMQISSTYNSQQSTFGETKYNGSQLSGYLNLIYQQEVGSKREENYFKVGASCQIDSVNESFLRQLYFHTSSLSFNWLEVVPGIFGEFNHNTDRFGLILGLRGDFTSFYTKYLLHQDCT